MQQMYQQSTVTVRPDRVGTFKLNFKWQKQILVRWALYGHELVSVCKFAAPSPMMSRTAIAASLPENTCHESDLI